MLRGKVIDLGRIAYDKAYELQMKYFEKRLNNEVPDILFLLEHDPVITLGKGGDKTHLLLDEEELKEKGIQFYPTTRGGDITYHGPGQLVGYPIFDLRNHGKKVSQTVRKYEKALIKALAEFGISAGILEGFPGVWIGNKKIAALGLAIRKWITFHGFALNVNNDLTPFSYIIPCGLQGKGVTSMKEELGHEVDMDLVKKKVTEKFGEVFNIEFEEEKL